MASTSSLVVLVGLMVACLCATASAGRVVPVEMTSMKLANGIGGLFGQEGFEISIGVELDLTECAPTQTVFVTIGNAVGPQPAVFELVGGEVSKLLHVKVCLYVETDPLLITIEALGMKKEVPVQLALLDPLVAGLPLAAITGLVRGVIVLVPTVVKGVVTALALSNGVGTPIATILP